MRILAVSALALVAATATPAFAQDSAPFSGPRIEAEAGVDHVGSEGNGRSGFLYGGAIGYDKQFNNIVIGADAEITGATTKQGGVEAGRDLYVGGRAGFVVGGSTLVYGKAGYTNARVSFGNDGQNNDGYRLGAGVERNFGRFFGKVEYRYSRYEKIDLNRDQVVAGVGVRF
ncbi:outer membrane protein [Sphingomonas kyeonggiensis]|uniref:Outer membrane immunogenic protein n=1 Tax=Sphingomonas kyeonggiensis TaxID=1268553 RepID=A0A7W6NUW0_9SPHN|nr:outer membrane beta-barrel protein [Sphingomonas kyeonggiensis]MBB4096772.1 outer membrane immunogenic protein [Sphingomonas kyeonggiensis]